MSKYIFIASDFKIPEVDLTNEQIITPIEAKLKGIKPPCFCSWDELDPNSEILYFKNEDDMANLCIRKKDDILDDVRFYTDKEFIYQVSCSFDKKRAKQLLDYIKDIKLIGPIELYSILLDDKVDVEYSTVSIENLNEEIILKIIEKHNSSLKIK
ncbi:hypothetical protein [Romboutsia ilealis]|uniref:hypothetical protein n=1 Tax=Romboutsia ilealis TaxID=1115758 RepID=UPI0023F364E2|nr:hypothetical protein [Romboutsia ilealis]